MVFPVVMYGCESWTIKKAECWRTDAFELWCWTRFLRVPWTARRSNQSILKEISPEYSSEELMLKKKKKKNWCWSSNALASWFKELIHWKRLWCWERLKAGGEGYDKGWDGWMASLIQWTWVWARSGSRWWTGRPDVLQSMGSQRVGHNERLNWRSWKIRKDWETTVRPEETQETQLDTMWVLDGILGRSVLWLVLCKSSCEHMFSVLLSNGL